MELDEKIKWLLIPKIQMITKMSLWNFDQELEVMRHVYLWKTFSECLPCFFKEKSWSFEVLNSNEGGTKGFREISLAISGEEVYGQLKFESEFIELQGFQKQNHKGRVHTSAITVAVLPEAEELILI